MKSIDKMTLTECLDALRELDPYSNMPPICIAIADRIHDLTRWIPVSERMPTKADGDRWGEVLVCYRESEVQCELVINVNGVQSSNKAITHWRRVDLPEAP